MQRFAEKPSMLLIPLIAAAAIFAAFGAGIAGSALTRTSRSAAALTQAGIMHGSIQRAVKLELSGIRADELFSEAGAAYASLVPINIYRKSAAFADFGTILKSFPLALALWREDASADSRQALVSMSEAAWDAGRQIIRDTERYAEDQRDLFLVGLLCTLMGVILTLFAVWVSKFMVADKVEVEAAFDPMTGALRRDRFMEKLASFIALRSKEQHVGVVMIDLDRFKGINDSFGHDAGDKVLAAVSGAIRSFLREGDAFGRLGGEEFAVAVRSKDRRAGRLFAERARAAVESLRLERLPHVTISLGVVVEIGRASCRERV